MRHRIDVDDSTFEILEKMSEGNPGAVHVLSLILRDAGKIDPDSVFGPIGHIMFLDSIGVYGSGIYILWNDVCNSSTSDLVMLIRACQLGFLPREQLVLASIDSPDNPVKLDVAGLRARVCERLPNFVG